MWNEPKEGIKAIATNRIYGKETVNPVGNVVKVNRYNREEARQREAGADFSSLLRQEMRKNQVRKAEPQPQLRMMGGLNQYDRHAREFCYILSREADFKV